MLSHRPVGDAVDVDHVPLEGLLGDEFEADGAPDLLTLHGLAFANGQMPDVQIPAAVAAVRAAYHVVFQGTPRLVSVPATLTRKLKRTCQLFKTRVSSQRYICFQ